ncbi:cyclin-like protein [Hesseltinella vesiculosa]|uniref:Cyclin-like protein n=1 Tax=Hesseltinella vesiculosa TaxID=101127 RepID=A0A1X2GBW0_9FUNG|nr:cyclin-like protein [Hesseltinella vesiculosa]
MGTSKSHRTRQATSRPAAIDFLSNISLGHAPDPIPTAGSPLSLHHQHTASTTSHASLVVGTACDCAPAPHTTSDIFDYTHISPYFDDDHGDPDMAAISLHSSDSSSSDDENSPSAMRFHHHHHHHHHHQPSLPLATSLLTSNDLGNKKKLGDRRRSSGEASHEHHKLTREDSERPIASEKIKKKSTTMDRVNGPSNPTILSVFRYYTEKLRQSTSRRKFDSATTQVGYVHQQQLANHDRRHKRVALSYAHFLSPLGTLSDDDLSVTPDDGLVSHDTYDPYFLDNDSYNSYGHLSSSVTSTGQPIRPADARKELNEQFRLAHPELAAEITLTKIRAIKAHLLEIGRACDLEMSTLAMSYVYFEKLVSKNVVTKKNRKLIAACCVFLSFKINEARGTDCASLLEAVDDVLDIDAKEIHQHEFAVFADLEFNLFVPRREFLPHFHDIFKHLENKSIEAYLGTSNFYEKGLKALHSSEDERI